MLGIAQKSVRAIDARNSQLEVAQMLQKPVFALPGCQRMRVNTLLCDTLGLAEMERQPFQDEPSKLKIGTARTFPCTNPAEQRLPCASLSHFYMGSIPVTTTTKIFPKVLRYKWEAYCNTNGRYEWEEY